MKRTLIFVIATFLAATGFAQRDQVSGTTESEFAKEGSVERFAASHPGRVVKLDTGYAVYADAASATSAKKNISPAVDSFGLNYSNYLLSAFETHDQDNSRTSHYGGSWVARTSGTNPLSMGYVHIPYGAKIWGFWVTFDDSNASTNFQIDFRKVDTRDDTVTNLATFTSSGSPGIVRNQSVPLAAIERADSPYDIYEFFFWFNTADPTIRAHDVKVWYKREMMTAPAAASFVDVPTSNFAFRGVEALKASGVTGGCTDATHFCPDDPVTRAQMALFLARALGLNQREDTGAPPTP